MAEAFLQYVFQPRLERRAKQLKLLSCPLFEVYVLCRQQYVDKENPCKTQVVCLGPPKGAFLYRG